MAAHARRPLFGGFTIAAPQHLRIAAASDQELRFAVHTPADRHHVRLSYASHAAAAASHRIRGDHRRLRVRHPDACGQFAAELGTLSVGQVSCGAIITNHPNTHVFRPFQSPSDSTLPASMRTVSLPCSST